ncbi:MAG: hypothetical protein MN733_42320 [Nitrososphaera sp.]|nr:hypothetical protein [Nitrososphaera sp.]
MKPNQQESKQKREKDLKDLRDALKRYQLRLNQAVRARSLEADTLEVIASTQKICKESPQT